MTNKFKPSKKTTASKRIRYRRSADYASERSAMRAAGMRTSKAAGFAKGRRFTIKPRLLIIAAAAAAVIAAVVLILTLGGTEAPETEVLAQTPVPTAAPTATVAPTPTPPPATPELALGQTVFANFDGEEDSTLYAAVEIQNTGQAPFIIDEGHVLFTLSDQTEITCDYAPPGKRADIIQPGETGYAAVWYVHGAPLGEELTISSAAFELTPLASADTAIPLSVENAEIVSNLSGYTQVVGRVRNESGHECYANVIYLAFYDTGQNLLGVYEFTIDGSFKNRQIKSFDVDMKFMPISTIALDTIEIKSRGVGIR